MSTAPSAQTIVILTLPHLSKVCGEECKALGFPPIDVAPLGVKVMGTFEDAMYLNLHLRTGNRVLWPLAIFPCKSPGELHSKVANIPWENWIDPKGYFSVHGYVKHPSIRNTQFAGMKVKDAIVDRMREKTGDRPNSGSDRDKAVVFYRWKDEICEIFVDTSGDTLSKHGYRVNPGKAPLQEGLAAAILLTSRWDKQVPLVNPMCGSGTLAIEAALLAMNKAPGLMRQNFGFMHLLPYDAKAWQRMVLDAAKKVNTKGLPTIIASDIRRQAISEARENAQKAGVDSFIQWGMRDFRKQTLPNAPGVLIYNPEYGERLGQDKDLEAIYGALGDYMKQEAGGYWAYVFTGNLDLAKKIGLRPSRKTPFLNANIECRLLEYELYSGTRRNIDPEKKEEEQ